MTIRVLRTELVVAVLTAMAFAATGLAHAKVEGDTIILGAVVSLTGKYTTAGNHTKRGYDVGVKHINARGGIKVGKKSYKLKVIYYDDESTPARGARPGPEPRDLGVRGRSTGLRSRQRPGLR